MLERGATTGSGRASWWRGSDPAKARALRRAGRLMAILIALGASVAVVAIGVIPSTGPGAVARASVATGVIPSTGPGAVARASVAEGDPPSGRELFAREWLPHDPRCHGGDGLGPVFNETSCLACHGQAAPGGGGPEDKNVEILSMNVATIGRQPETMAIRMNFAPLSVGAVTINGRIGCPPESVEVTMPADGLVLSAGRSKLSGKLFRIRTDRDGRGWVASSDEGEIRGELLTIRPDDRALMKVHPGLRHATSAVFHRSGVDPRYERWRSDLKARIPADSAVDLFGARVSISRRNPPPLFGAGMIGALPDEVFVEAAAREPVATRGRVSRMEDGRIGRFGWKAQIATLGEFVLSACANELGLEVPGHHQHPSPLEPDASAKSLDLTRRECNALVSYVRDLPAPIQLDPSSPSGSRAIADGRRLFESVGCAACHTPSLGPIEGIYSDLLLHDIGLTDDGMYYGSEGGSPDAPKASEWRTSPLWGVRDSAPYLHDGRARTLAEAVALHRGQGTDSARAFEALSEGDRRRVLAFLSSLSAPVGPDQARRRQADPDPGAGQEQVRPSVQAPRAVRAEARRRRAEEAAARAEEQRRQAEEVAARTAWQEQRRREAAKAAHLAATLHSAQALEKMGKTRGALDFYGALVREAPDSAEARAAAERIKALSP